MNDPEYKLKGQREMDKEEMHKRIDTIEAWFVWKQRIWLFWWR